MKKLFLGAGCASLMLFSSCNNNNDGGGDSVSSDTIVTTVAEDKVNINATLDEMVVCLGAMRNGAMLNLLVSFAGLSEGEAMKEEFIEDVFSNIETEIDKIDIPEDNQFHIDLFTGTWSYNLTNTTWSRSNSPSNKIVIEFPSDDTQTSNNAKIVLAGYADKKYYFDDEDVFLPKTFDIEMSVDGSKICGVRLEDIVYEQSSEFAIPVSINCSMFMSPFTMTVSGDRSTGTKFECEMALDDGSGCGYGMSAELNLAHNDYENIDDEDFVDLKGDFFHNDLKLDYFVDLAKLIKLDNLNDDITDDQINDNIDFAISLKSSKVANLILREGNDDFEVRILYKDGTSENSSVYYESFADDVEALFSDITGAWEDI